MVPSLRYPYSGQTFGGCAYTSCPVLAGVPTVYEYELVTLESPFNFLMINLTQSFDGPSILCTGFYAQYLPSDSVDSSDAPPS
ncbi:hypothetical protein MNV49_005730 [Pseudohyphozyma bogoriensis]|nr:hypothetical protein MNV49_005730 [Pseudohyphozyma bogoriensis]